MPGYGWFPTTTPNTPHHPAYAPFMPHHPSCSPFMPFHLTPLGGI